MFLIILEEVARAQKKEKKRKKKRNMVPKIPLSPKLKNSNSIRATYLKISLEIVGATKLNETTYKKYLNRASM